MSEQQERHSFTTSKAHLNVENNYISFAEFLGNIALAFAIIVVSAVLWKIFWHSLNKLTIRNLKTGRDEPIGPTQPISNTIKSLYRILKSLTLNENGYVLDACGFEAFTYLFFLRRFIHLMAIFTLTDLFIWMPYLFIFSDQSQFSLASTPSHNYLFRTFYTLWITIAVLYSLSEMKTYLRLLLKHRLFRNLDTRKSIVNNLKSKTVYVHFAREPRKLDLLEVKTRLVERLRVEDTILGIIELPNNSQKIQLQYDYKIYEIVRMLGLHNFSKAWHFFKLKKSEAVKDRLRDRYERIFRQRKRHSSEMDRFVQDFHQHQPEPYLNSYLVAFENISTPEELIHQVESKKGCCDLISQTRQRNEVENYFQDEYNLTVSWAQEPADIMWINIGAPYRVKVFKFVLFNVLSGLLIAVGFVVIVLARSTNILSIPKILLPIMMSTINATLRWLISKSSQWENRHFQYELQMKEMKVLIIFFAFNVIGGSLVRDTLNLVDILTTGWGFIELFGLIYKHPDGFFYYGYILNEMALTIFAALFKLGDIFPEVFDSNFTYQKNEKVRHKSKYGTNDTFRYGYMYSLDIILFAVIFMYSASTPLIHLFGFAYFYVKFYTAGYTLVVFHKYEETCSNTRIIEKVCQYITIVMILIVFLIGITLMFEGQYPSVLILYFWEGVILYMMYRDSYGSLFMKDYYTDDLLRSHDMTQYIRQWKQEYLKSMQPLQANEYERLFIIQEEID